MNARQGLALVCGLGWIVATLVAGRGAIWLGMASAALLLGALVAWRAPAERRELQLAPRQLLLGTLIGLAMASVTLAIYPTLARALPEVARQTRSLYDALGPVSPARALLLWAVVVGEELVWRGLIQGVLVARIGARAGVPLGALAYAIVLAPLGSPVLVLVAGACGLVWGLARATRLGLGGALWMHLIWDVAILVVYPLEGGG